MKCCIVTQCPIRKIFLLFKKIVLELGLTFQKQIYTIFSKEKTDLMIRIDEKKAYGQVLQAKCHEEKKIVF
jgi:hypothetical protein